MQDAAILLVMQGARVEARGALSDDLLSLCAGNWRCDGMCSCHTCELPARVRAAGVCDKKKATAFDISTKLMYEITI